MLYLELQCHSLNRGAAATGKTVLKSLSHKGAVYTGVTGFGAVHLLSWVMVG